MWIYQGKEVDDELIEGKIGFVYIITRIVDDGVAGRSYVGKKLFKKTRRTKVKGKTRRKKVVTDSDWKDYFGSNAELLEDVKKYGPQYFKREILHLCDNKGTCSYLELKEQISRCVLESDAFYNSWIFVKVRKSHLKL
jgi:hypothetical protein